MGTQPPPPKRPAPPPQKKTSAKASWARLERGDRLVSSPKICFIQPAYYTSILLL